MTAQIAPVSLVLLATIFTSACSQPPLTVADGLEVDLIYVAKLADGTVIDQNPETGPITFVVGTGKLQPTVEKLLIGLEQGQKKVIEVADAYGVHIADKTGNFPRSALADGTKVGDSIEMVDGTTSTIKEIRDQVAIIDLNHPLAGKLVIFEVEIADVRKPEAPGKN